MHRSLLLVGAFLLTVSGQEVVSRAEWGARRPKSISRMRTPVSMVFIHHTAGPSCSSLRQCSASMRQIQNFHMNNNGWSDIGYNFLVGEDGRVYQGRGWDRVGAHTYGYNSKAVAVCFIGTYTSREPSNSAIYAAQNLIDQGVRLGYISAGYELFGHRQAGCTECPGNALFARIQSWPAFSNRRIPKYC